jgi:magnesium chelatase family protein
VLFLDEFPEMRREVLEGLREPLEDGVVRLVRGGYRVVFPSRFQLAVAMNPCPCGFLGHPLKPCTCTPVAIRRYHARVSGPLLDRIDLVVSLAPVRFRELVDGPRASTTAIRDRVLAARARAARRQGACVNAQLPIATLRRISPLTRGARALVERAVEELGFSARAHDRALRVGRTIADLRGGGDRITETDMAEAMQYRGMVG